VSASSDEPREYESPEVYDLGAVVAVTHGCGKGSDDAIGQGFS
jgi:hypothetical protein